ncbi:NADP-dependent oxidoreductase domain-containing protein 1 [Mesocricetus auratus]|uniref:NADP-dependent oxidoreductase domain-containing protein 1 n=1 Tax=Mesocricetus auratus TaxID=10036 RepID=A0A1U7QZ32_MESAU|nr:NADP-dependent oxidoreductase domain-containing protein 1 [Mesocricetus auratus]XP_040599296.1 NADP-dependent oxidoreductase domain-containing protein 1 [Mesocricetus auratus]XP_040599297.1 NADP-dependent oxidoreductase domain-containing protein 1 [Mesocricetus auratus]XP_040599298.1 NADP-dependent oxidoreductase domain-containing protein 1 [Mesocricetus auratus]XP_040599299.1 NADP-dependent oxidoreductase domain-containing protein 1 [Mesocricetus auratus]XP_040599300.1 NADP-dependent oxido
MSILDDLESLKFEYGIPEEERYWLYLQGRYRGLMIKGCAHAVFFCKLFSTLRELLHQGRRTTQPRTVSFDAANVEDERLKVGIIGCGHLGKQLANVLLRLVPIPAENLQISTRRPEALVELQKQGVRCFYNNASLARWAKVLFLCCLPAQLPNICLEIQSKLEKTCTVYSFVAAIPLPRLKLLLNHTNILRPQYQFSEDFDNIWGGNKDITTVLQDPVILQGTCPYSSVGGVILNIKWLEGVLYAAINACTAKKMIHSQVLQLLNKVFLSEHLESCEKDEESCPKFQLTDFMNKNYIKNFFHKRPFPWFDLTIAQLKETPFSQHLSTTPVLQEHLTLLYCKSFGIPLVREKSPEAPKASPSQGVGADKEPRTVSES